MDLQHFFLVGVNYKKTDVSVRGQFALNTVQYENLLSKAKLLGLSDVFVISTCNRTEIYGIAPSANVLSHLLCSETHGSLATLEDITYIRQSREAAEHLFEVAAGLDSQILGDYEIMGQMKTAVKIAKDKGTVSAFLERLTNTAFQSSKDIKNKTRLSGGTVSVSFAAIQFLKWHIKDFSTQRILVLGTGSIGSSTVKNLIDYTQAPNITLINRTDQKATALAAELNVRSAPYSHLKEELALANIIIVATNSDTPVVNKNILDGCSNKILLDLSIPNNIAPDVKELRGNLLVNVDELSQISDHTVSQRLQEVPAAKALIAEHLAEFYDWYRMRKNVPLIRAAKKALSDLHECGLIQPFADDDAPENVLPTELAISTAIKKMAVQLKSNDKKPGCNYIQAIHDFLAVTTN